MKKNKLEYPTLVIQLSNDMGLPYDMPDDWLEMVMSIANRMHSHYNTGLDVAYGMATKEGFNLIDKEVNQWVKKRKKKKLKLH